MQPLPSPTPSPDSFHLWQTIGASVVGGVVGVLSTIVTFKTRMALQDSAIRQIGVDMTREHTGIKQSISQLRDDTDRRHGENQEALQLALGRADRRLEAILRIVAALARHNGTDQRFDDTLLRLITDADKE